MTEKDEEQRPRLPQRGQPDMATVAGGQLDIGGRVADLERQMKPSSREDHDSLRARSGRKARVHAVDVAGVEADDVVGRCNGSPAISMRETIRRARARRQAAIAVKSKVTETTGGASEPVLPAATGERSYEGTAMKSAE
jgi:hypothetical protein